MSFLLLVVYCDRKHLVFFFAIYLSHIIRSFCDLIRIPCMHSCFQSIVFHSQCSRIHLKPELRPGVGVCVGWPKNRQQSYTSNRRRNALLSPRRLETRLKSLHSEALPSSRYPPWQRVRPCVQLLIKPHATAEPHQTVIKLQVWSFTILQASKQENHLIPDCGVDFLSAVYEGLNVVLVCLFSCSKTIWEQCRFTDGLLKCSKWNV